MRKIYTRTGDSGETSLVSGERVLKDSIRVEAYGAVDETNAAIGLARTQITDTTIAHLLRDIQNTLFDMGSELATTTTVGSNLRGVCIEASQVQALESALDEFQSQMPELKNFVLPGGTEAAARLHCARTACRLAERRVVTLQKTDDVNKQILFYLNRLSDLLFVLACVVNKQANISELEWQKPFVSKV